MRYPSALWRNASIWRLARLTVATAAVARGPAEKKKKKKKQQQSWTKS
jgi:hypothetical protein